MPPAFQRQGEAAPSPTDPSPLLGPQNRLVLFNRGPPRLLAGQIAARQELRGARPSPLHHGGRLGSLPPLGSTTKPPETRLYFFFFLSPRLLLTSAARK